VSRKDDATADRLTKLAATGKAPDWLAQVVRTIAEHSHEIEQIKDDRETLPEFIYRH